MNVAATFRVAIRSLARNRLRSFLTMLGVIIGILAVVAMMAIGSGARGALADQFASLGSNSLFVMPGAANAGGVRGGMGSGASLTIDDMRAIERESSAVKRAAAIQRSQAQITAFGQNWNAPVYGVTPGYFEVREWDMTSGGVFSESDYESGNTVCIIGNTVKENLFGEIDPVDPDNPTEILIKGLPCRVIGLLAKKGQAGFGDQDDVVLMPFKTLKQRLVGGPPDTVSMIMASATGPDDTSDAKDQMTSVLRQRHRIREGEPEDFFVRDLREIAENAQKSISTISALLGGIALLSLLIGGIGIMNIMLVSVTERTREIGIRMALGARGKDILAQFLVEAIVLALVGGIVGVAGGVWASGVIAKLVGVPPNVSVDVIMMAFLFSTAVGLFFGFYPARRASRLDPIDALRYE